VYVVVEGDEGVVGVEVVPVVVVAAIATARIAKKQIRTAKNFMLTGSLGAFEFG